MSGAALTLLGAVESRFPALEGSGAYAFAEVPAGDWQLSPRKHGDLRGAVTSLDAARVLQAVSGMRPFTPMQALACDVTGDGTVSTLDASLILQLAAGMIASLPAGDACQSDWLFVPEPLALDAQSVTMPALAGGACRSGAITYAPLQGSAADQDFTAMVLGDCTGNWDASATGAALQRRRDLPQVWLAPARRVHAGRWQVAIEVAGLDGAQAFEARLAVDPARARVHRVVLPGARGAMARIGDDDHGQLRIAAALASVRPLDAQPLAVLVVDTPVDEAPPDIRLLAVIIDEQATAIAR